LSSGEAFSKPRRYKVDQQQLDDGEPDDYTDHLPVHGLERSNEIAGRGVRASQGCPKLFENRVNDALHSAPVSCERKTKLFSLV
jgi:hypothetical protein